jgi:AcrR family transcriptional regulator
MKQLLSHIRIQVNSNIYLKDPETTELGKKLVSASIEMIDEMGFENFTFKKLATRIGSTEASMYRYFVNKHKLLLYLTAWYWAWMEYKMEFAMANVPSPQKRLEKAMDLLTEQVVEDNRILHIDEVKLHRVVLSESSKAYLTKEVDIENKEGAFLGYKRLVKRVSDLILEINPDYKYPNMLISTLIEGVHHQRFFAQHLPRLTDTVEGEDSIQSFYCQLVTKLINK